jgi:hypothetical protein
MSYLKSRMNSITAVVRNSLRMEERHFRSDLRLDEAITLFREHVELIEVETTSYCNRTCSFCPNSFIDRLSEKHSMPESTWQAILDGLRSVNYEGTLVWSRYSEPLSEQRIIERIRQVREVAPRTRIAINSNGDYLDADYLRELEDAGVNRLWIDIYFPDEAVYNQKSAASYHDKFLKRIHRDSRLLREQPELAYRITSEKMEIVTHVRNVAAMRMMDLSDRGGLIQIARQTQRVSPCYAPYKHLVIDWDGSIIICCQLRSDSPSHQEGVIGKISDQGLSLVTAYAQLAGWRKGLRDYGKKQGLCATCNVSEYDDTRFMRELAHRLTNTDSALRNAIKGMMSPMLKKRSRY